MGVDEACERLPGLELSRGKRTVVIRDVFTLVFPASDEGWVEEWSGLRIRREFSVHLGMLRELGVRECGYAGRSALWDMRVNGMTMPRRGRCGVVGNGVEVNHGISGNHVGQLRCHVFWGNSLQVLGFLVHFEVVCWVVRRWRLECGWERVVQAGYRGA